MSHRLMFASLVTSSLALAAAALAADAGSSAPINAITPEGIGAEIGKASFTESKDGLTVTIEAKGLTVGDHGVHVHEKGNCAAGEKDGKKVAGLAAGPHFDPDKTGKHEGPHGAGHKGDLPKLTVSGADVKATLVAPRLKLADVAGRALIIHEAGDTYTDTPELGGGKSRVACAVIPAK